MSENSRNYSKDEHEVFPGITIAYCNSHVPQASPEEMDSPVNVFEIFHCREGRMECRVSEDYTYISQGDLMIANAQHINHQFSFPLSHYHGIVIRINIESAPKCLSCFLQDVNVSPKMIADKFCRKKGYYITRSNSFVEHIFHELYHVPEEIRCGYTKIKILELMLFLSALPVNHELSSVSPAQVSLAKAVAKYLSENMNEKITLDMASKKFHSSATNIKNAIKAVYGVSFYAFIKANKMESAAYMLEYTDKSVIEIANEHGYDNGSKFASAFQSVKGLTPSEYRNINYKFKED